MAIEPAQEHRRYEIRLELSIPTKGRYAFWDAVTALGERRLEVGRLEGVSAIEEKEGLFAERAENAIRERYRNLAELKVNLRYGSLDAVIDLWSAPPAWFPRPEEIGELVADSLATTFGLPRRHIRCVTSKETTATPPDSPSHGDGSAPPEVRKESWREWLQGILGGLAIVGFAGALLFTYFALSAYKSLAETQKEYIDKLQTHSDDDDAWAAAFAALSALPCDCRKPPVPPASALPPAPPALGSVSPGKISAPAPEGT